jgi:hypothetical protein
MKLIKLLFLSISTIFFTLACGVREFSTLATDAPSLITSLTPPSTNTPFPIPTPTFLFSALPTEPFPAWVTDFSDPILVAVGGRQPDFQDDFTGLNEGWFYFKPGSKKGPYYALIQDETLLVNLPIENKIRDSWVYSPLLTRKDFVLSFDFQFEETQPDATMRFQFDQNAEQSVALDLVKNQTWSLHWGPNNDLQSTNGTYDYYPPQRIPVLVIMHGEECAVYLNDAPLAYLNDCRSGSNFHSTPWAVNFHMLAEQGHAAALTIDNVKLWDLDKIPEVP